MNIYASSGGLEMPVINLPKFIDFDSCCLCNSHQGPFVWVTIKGDLRFVCEDCYEKFFKNSTNATLEKVKKGVG